ncbi:hypothetical protein M0I87_003550 [Pseudomonas aeruginosa]|nr:hypothetical protein [Pseudomonas aeruginosa]EKX5088402.1 hypothetical protein [Pseudomonas aeruginosa]
MKIRRSIEKRMKDLEGSGRGCFYEREEEGQILFSTHLEEGRLDIYINGFAFGVEGRMRKLLFSEVVRIVSHLSIEMFSSAGDQGDLDFYVPLDVECESLNVTLSVPFLAYSNIMNILLGLREDWIKRDHSDG